MAIYLRKYWSWLFLAIPLNLVLVSCKNHSNSYHAGAPDEGKQIYQKYCVACHGEKGKMKAGNAADLSMSDINEDSIRKVILYGNDKGMGPYKTIIKNDTTIKALVEYVKTLRTH